MVGRGHRRRVLPSASTNRLTETDNSNALWKSQGLQRAVDTRSWSFSSNDVQTGSSIESHDTTYGQGSFLSPFVQDNGTSYQGFSETTYPDDAYDMTTGLPNAGAPPTVNSWTLSNDGFGHYSKSVSQQTISPELWAFGKKFASEIENHPYNFSSDDQVIDSDPESSGHQLRHVRYAPLVRADGQHV